MPTEILAGKSRVTVILVFATTPENQRQLIDLLERHIANVAKQPGFISSNLHTSNDGLRVVNYGQWESMAEFQAMMAQSQLRPGREKAEAISKPDARVYEVVAAFHP
jgi:quinol monooxygenase YgiN